MRTSDLLALRQGERKALLILMEVYTPHLYRFCLSFTKNQATAEEVCQDVFLKIWQYRDSIDVHQNFDAYIFKIARNQCVNYLKSAKNQYSIRKVMLDQINVAQQAKAEQNLYYQDYINLASEAIETLPERCKEIYLLRKNEGLSNSLIAEKLNISVNTVRAQIVKSNAILRKYLQEKTDLTFFMLLYLGVNLLA